MINFNIKIGYDMKYINPVINYPRMMGYTPVYVWIYVLKLEDAKWYIGYAPNLPNRLQQHYAGEGAKWTKLHKPITLVRMIKVLYEDARKEEDRITLEYFDKYGLAVRGGSWCYTNLKSRPHLNPVPCLEDSKPNPIRKSKQGIIYVATDTKYPDSIKFYYSVAKKIGPPTKAKILYQSNELKNAKSVYRKLSDKLRGDANYNPKLKHAFGWHHIGNKYILEQILINWIHSEEEGVAA